jgi:hypothetical protein
MKKNCWQMNLIIISEIIYIILSLTNLIGIINEIDIYMGFIISILLSGVSFVLSICLMLKSFKNKKGILFLLLCISILQILFTVFIYLLPEAGIQAPISF